jgi:hypothetical protein
MKPKKRLPIFFLLLCVIPLGFYTKFYAGPGHVWIHKYGGDVFYPIFWIYVILFFKPKIDVIRSAVVVFMFSTLIEFSQLLSHPLLEIIRKTFIGRTIIGTDFESIDILYYLVGCVWAVLLYGFIFQTPFRSFESEK